MTDLISVEVIWQWRIGNDQYECFDTNDNDQVVVTVCDIAKGLLKENEVLNNIHNVIERGLDAGNDDLYDVTLSLQHGVSFSQ